MTITEIKRDIAARTGRYACLCEEDKTYPVRTIMHISEVIAVEEFPAVIFVLISVRYYSVFLSKAMK